MILWHIRHEESLLPLETDLSLFTVSESSINSPFTVIVYGLATMKMKSTFFMLITAVAGAASTL